MSNKNVTVCPDLLCRQLQDLPTMPSKGEILCEKVVEFIIRSDITVLREISIKKLADIFSVNRSHLSRTFKSCRNECISAYLKRMKIIKIALLMGGNNDITINQVALSAGYKNADHFSKSFKNFLCIYPSQFKKYFFQHNKKPKRRKK